MSTRAITLDEKHYLAAEEKARALGKTPEEYLHTLIDADSRSFDEILQPVREGFGQMSDEDIDDLLDRAQKAARQNP
jgi:hypothetical protein